MSGDVRRCQEMLPGLLYPQDLDSGELVDSRKSSHFLANY